jgi:hypothetical protein
MPESYDMAASTARFGVSERRLRAVARLPESGSGSFRATAAAAAFEASVDGERVKAAAETSSSSVAREGSRAKAAAHSFSAAPSFGA